MINKWEGRKIVIEFNMAVKELQPGNELAFTVKGMEKDPRFHGELVEKEYTVQSVEYPEPLNVSENYNEEEKWNQGSHNDTEASGSSLTLQGVE